MPSHSASFSEVCAEAPPPPANGGLDSARLDAFGSSLCSENKPAEKDQTADKRNEKEKKPEYKGTLFLIGGAADPAGSLGDLVKLAGKNAKIAIVCQASEDFDDSARVNVQRFIDAGVPRENLSIITKPGTVFSDNTIASSSDIPADTNVVFFAGGAQSRLRDDFTAKQLQQVDKLLRDGGIVAGSSAGAAVMSREMIERDDDENPDVPRHSRGFGLLDRYIIDTHVAQRKRQTRDVESLHWGRKYNENAVIALDENTAVAINLSQHTARVYGHKDEDGEIEGQAHVFLEVPELRTNSNVKPYVRKGAAQTGHQAYEYDIPNGVTFELP